jgi:hypothetical protein
VAGFSEPPKGPRETALGGWGSWILIELYVWHQALTFALFSSNLEEVRAQIAYARTGEKARNEPGAMLFVEAIELCSVETRFPRKMIIQYLFHPWTAARLAFPYFQNAPTKRLQPSARLSIPFYVAQQFRFPEFAVCRWKTGLSTSLMLVPKTAVNEYYRIPLGKHHVRSAGQVATVKPIAQAAFVCGPTHNELRPGIF